MTTALHITYVRTIRLLPMLVIACLSVALFSPGIAPLASCKWLSLWTGPLFVSNSVVPADRQCLPWLWPLQPLAMAHFIVPLVPVAAYRLARSRMLNFKPACTLLLATLLVLTEVRLLHVVLPCTAGCGSPQYSARLFPGTQPVLFFVRHPSAGSVGARAGAVVATHSIRVVPSPGSVLGRRPGRHVCVLPHHTRARRPAAGVQMAVPYVVAAGAVVWLAHGARRSCHSCGAWTATRNTALVAMIIVTVGVGGGDWLALYVRTKYHNLFLVVHRCVSSVSRADGSSDSLPHVCVRNQARVYLCIINGACIDASGAPETTTRHGLLTSPYSDHVSVQDIVRGVP